MNALLIKLLNMSAAGSVLILAVVVLRAVLKKAPRWIICLMWALVAIRLICPISISSPVSAFRATTSIVSESGEVELFRPAGGSEKPLLAVDTVQIERPQASAETIREIPGTSYAVTQRSRDAYLPPLVQAYLLGLTGLLLYALVSTLLLRKKVSVSLQQRGNIRVCDEVASPFILGIFRPVIYLPSSLSEEEKRFVLAHERAHLRRLDHIWKPLGFLILSVHWFNPFCWLAYVLLCRDIELACDEKVIRELGRAERAAYSQTLLNCSAHRILAACPVAFGETDVKTRVKAVLNYKKPGFWIILVALLSCIVLIVCFATNPIQEQDLSFLNYKNAIPLIGQNHTAPYANLYPADSDGVQPGVADAKALAQFLESADWTKRRAPSSSPEPRGYLELIIEDDYRIIVYQSERLAAVRFGNDIRYYRTGAGDYEAALATFIPAPSTEPDRPPEQTFDTELILSDPLSFLLSFSNAEIVTLIDNTGRSYEGSGKSFHEIISSQTWTAQAIQGFTTVEPSRQIYLRGDDYWCLSFEQTAPDSEMTCFAHNLLSSQSMLISFDCGKNLMDELMAWAIARQQESSAGIDLTDPEGILLSFSNAQVVTVIDETDRSYENTGRNFAEIVSAQTWSAHQTEGFPASYPDRLIVMIHGDWELRIEEATGECLYMVFPKDSDANSLVTYLDCGKNLMDELMPWATYEAGKPMGSGLTADDENRIELMFSELADAAQAGSSSLPSLTRWADRDPGGVVRLCELIGLYAESHRLDSGQIETLLPLIHNLDGANAEAFAALLAKLHRLYPAPFDIALARYADRSGDNRPNDLLRFADPGFSLDQELVVFSQIYTNLASVVHMQWGEQYEQIAPRVADMQLYFCSSKLPDGAVWIVNGASPAWAVNIPLERGLAAVFFAEDGVPVALWPGTNERPKLSVTSGNITVEPYPITRFSETWTENGQLSADALPIESELEAHKDEIPVLRLDGELQVRMPENTITLVFYLLDGKTGEQLKSETLYNETRQQSSIMFSVSQLDGLAPGRYLCCFYFVQACILSESEGLFDRLGDNCYFWLEIPER